MVPLRYRAGASLDRRGNDDMARPSQRIPPNREIEIVQRNRNRNGPGSNRGSQRRRSNPKAAPAPATVPVRIPRTEGSIPPSWMSNRRVIRDRNPSKVRAPHQPKRPRIRRQFKGTPLLAGLPDESTPLGLRPSRSNNLSTPRIPSRPTQDGRRRRRSAIPQTWSSNRGRSDQPTRTETRSGTKRAANSAAANRHRRTIARWRRIAQSPDLVRNREITPGKPSLAMMVVNWSL